MEIAVWDTYVTKKDGTEMHFDILVPNEMKDTQTIFKYGQEFLKSRGQEGQKLDASECSFCHVGKASAEVIEAIEDKGYFIIRIEGCD